MLRDAAALLTLASEGGAPRPTVTGAVQRIEAARGLTSLTSTQENAWLVLAARAIAKDTSGVSINADGENRTGPFYRSVRASDLKGPLRVTNTGEAPLQAVVSVTGAPLTPEPAAEKGFKIERTFYTLAGEVVDPSKAKQNDRFAVVLKMTEAQPQFGRIVVADYLPAGFEIDNPRIVSSGDTGTLSWIEDAVPPAFSEFRDDRFTAAFDRESKSPAVFTVAYVVRAVSPGATCCRKPMSRICTGPTASAAPAPGRSRSRREMSEARTYTSPEPGAGTTRFAWRVCRLRPWRDGVRVSPRPRLLCLVTSPAGVVDRLARPRAARPRPRLLDAGRRPRRPAAAAVRHQRRPLAAAGDRSRCRPALHRPAAGL